MPRLENWKMVVHPYDADGYTAPEATRYCLRGIVYGHTNPRHFDGKEIRTSTIQEIDIKNRMAITSNSVYELGTPDPEWLEWVRVKKIQGYEELFND